MYYITEYCTFSEFRIIVQWYWTSSLVLEHRRGSTRTLACLIAFSRHSCSSMHINLCKQWSDFSPQKLLRSGSCLCPSEWQRQITSNDHLFATTINCQLPTLLSMQTMVNVYEPFSTKDCSELLPHTTFSGHDVIHTSTKLLDCSNRRMHSKPCTRHIETSDKRFLSDSCHPIREKLDESGNRFLLSWDNTLSNLKKVCDIWGAALYTNCSNSLENLALPSCSILHMKGCDKI